MLYSSVLSHFVSINRLPLHRKMPYWHEVPQPEARTFLRSQLKMSRPVLPNRCCFLREFSILKGVPVVNHRAAFGVGAWVLCSLVIISGVSEAASRHGLRGHIKAPDCPAQVTNQAPPPFAVLRAGEAITVDFLAAPERGISTRIGSDGRIYWPYSAPVLVADLGVAQAEQALRAAVQNVFFDPDLRIGLAPAYAGRPSAPACTHDRLADLDPAGLTPQNPADRLEERGSDSALSLPGSEPIVNASTDELVQTALQESLVAQAAETASHDESRAVSALNGDAARIVDERAVEAEPAPGDAPVIALGDETKIVQPKQANIAPIAELASLPPAPIETESARIEPERKKRDWFGAPRARSPSRLIIP